MSLSFPNLGRNDPMRRASDFSLGTPVNQPMTAPATMPRSKSMFGGVLDYMGQQNPQTGLTRAEGFAAALDPLVMPSMRSGEAIRQRGAQRMSVSQANKTVEMLRARGREDLANMVELGMISATDAASQLLTQPKSKGRVVDASVLRQMFPGAQIDDGLYNLKPDGTANKIGGGGVSVSVGSDKGISKFAELDAKALAEVSETGMSASRSLAQINRLESLLSNVQTGIGANVKQIAGNFGIQTEGLGDIQAAVALINALVPAQRPAGSGPMSDADLELFKQSLPRIINAPGGNQIIIDTLRGIAQYDAMGAAIVQRYRASDQSADARAIAFAELSNRPDPFANFVASTSIDGLDGMTPAEALELLGGNS